jgi:hypothetical protein
VGRFVGRLMHQEISNFAARGSPRRRAKIALVGDSGPAAARKESFYPDPALALRLGPRLSGRTATLNRPWRDWSANGIRETGRLDKWRCT